jgi:hypothetical protein
MQFTLQILHFHADNVEYLVAANWSVFISFWFESRLR